MVPEPRRVIRGIFHSTTSRTAMADSTRFMSLDEVLRVLRDLTRRKKRSHTSFLNLIIFRFACCCGLRRAEIAGLQS